MKNATMLAVTAVFLLTGLPAEAKIAKALQAAVKAEYSPAVDHRGLWSAQDDLNPGDLRSFVTLVQGGIPAAKAEFFVQNQDYEYRGVLINTQTGASKSRRGKVYTFLERGTVMILSGVTFSGNKVYFKLLTPDVYTRHNVKEKHPSRVAVMLGFEFPEQLVSGDNSAALLAELSKWVQSFPNRQRAEDFAAGIMR